MSRTRGKIVAMHLENEITYHYTEDLPSLLKTLNASQNEVLGETTTKDYLKDEKGFQKRMESKI